MRSILLALGLFLVGLAPASAQTFNQRAVVSFTGTGDQIVVAGVAGKRISVFGLDLSLSTPQTLQLKSGSNALTGAMTMNAWSKPILLTAPAYFVTNAGENLVITMGGSATVGGIIWYTQQ